MGNNESYQKSHNFFGPPLGSSLCRHWCNPHLATTAHTGANTVFHLLGGVWMPPAPPNGHKPLHIGPHMGNSLGGAPHGAPPTFICGTYCGYRV